MTEKKTYRVAIDESLCKGCGLCVYYCPGKCLELAEYFNSAGCRPARMKKQEACTGCGTCYLMCPEYIITIKVHEKK